MGIGLRGRVLCLFLPLSLVSPQTQPDQSLLPDLLKKGSAYCEKFAGTAFHFVCLEDIQEKIYLPYRVKGGLATRRYENVKNHYIYDYQLVRNKEEIKERRVLLEENGQPRNVPDAALLVRRFKYEYVILGSGLLDPSWREYHDFKIVGDERIGRDQAVILEAVPKPGVQTERLYGKFWVRAGDGQVLKIEWDQRSMSNYAAAEETAKALKSEPHIQIALEYGFEEKGIRFPSRFTILEEYVNPRGLRYVCLETEVRFTKYKFFTVETMVEIRK